MPRNTYDHDRHDPFTTTTRDPDTSQNCPHCTPWWKCLRHRDDTGADSDENQWIIRTRRETRVTCMCTPTTPCSRHCRPRFP